MANEPRKPFQSPAPLPLPTPTSSTKDKDKGGAVLPLWNTGGAGDKLGGMPLFRGAAQKSGGLVGRLKSLKTKDVAFIGAGLAVLVMAPLAEYLISEGEDKAGQLQGGFANNSSPFNEGRDPSEIGIMGLARGGVPGDGSDVITPLNARDPSSLIMGGTGEKQEAPASTLVEPKRDAPSSVWDKVVTSAKAGASAATRGGGLPKPGGKLAGAINGLRSLSGGSTGASLKLSAPDSKGLFSSPKNQSSLAATQPVPGYRGAGARVIAGGSGGNSGGRTSGGFGSPGGGAAGDVMSGGISGGGRGSGFSGGDGDPTKNPGGNSTKDAKTLGESLAFLRQKMEMEKAIDLKWAKKRYDELERKKMIEQTLVQTAQQAFMKVLDKLLEGKKDGGGSPGGGSPGGGAPGGGKPDAGKPGAENGSPAALPGGVGRVAPVPKPEKVPSAEQTRLAAVKTHQAAGKSIGEMEGNAGSLDKLGTGLDTRDTTMAEIKTALGQASSEVRAAAAKLTEENKKPEAALKALEKTNKELGGKVDRLETAAQEAKTAADAGVAQAAKLQEPKWQKGEQYAKLIGGADPEAVKTDPVTQKLQALTGEGRNQVQEPEASKPDVKGALAKLEEREKAIGAIYDKAIAVAQRQNNAAFVQSFTAAKQEMTQTMARVRENVQTASQNIETAYSGIDAAVQSTNDLQIAYNEALRGVTPKVRAIDAGKEKLSDAVKAYSGGGTTTVGDDGTTHNEAPNTARTGAMTATQKAVAELGKALPRVAEAKKKK